MITDIVYREYPDISNELKNLTEYNRDKLEECEISDDKIDKINKKISFGNIVSYNLTDDQRKVVNIYNILSSNSLRNVLIIRMILGIIIIELIDFYKFSFIIYTSISSFLSGLFVKFGVVNIIKMVAW